MTEFIVFVGLCRFQHCDTTVFRPTSSAFKLVKCVGCRLLLVCGSSRCGIVQLQLLSSVFLFCISIKKAKAGVLESYRLWSSLAFVCVRRISCAWHCTALWAVRHVCS